jgi:hypothetical protein
MGGSSFYVFPRVLALPRPIATTAKPNCHTLRDHSGSMSRCLGRPLIKLCSLPMMSPSFSDVLAHVYDECPYPDPRSLRCWQPHLAACATVQMESSIPTSKRPRRSGFSTSNQHRSRLQPGYSRGLDDGRGAADEVRQGLLLSYCSGPGAAESLSDTLTPRLGWIRHGLVGR